MVFLRAIGSMAVCASGLGLTISGCTATYEPGFRNVSVALIDANGTSQYYIPKCGNTPPNVAVQIADFEGGYTSILERAARGEPAGTNVAVLRVERLSGVLRLVSNSRTAVNPDSSFIAAGFFEDGRLRTSFGFYVEGIPSSENEGSLTFGLSKDATTEDRFPNTTVLSPKDAGVLCDS